MSAARTALAAALAALCFAAIAAPSALADDPYEYNPALSLTGDCSVSPFDPIKDPSCPEEPPGGRFDTPVSITVDAHGNEYVASWDGGTEGRIDIFDHEGRFITEISDPFGPKSMAVDTDGNLYVIEQAPGAETDLVRYTPTVYEPEVGKIEYGNPRVVIDTSENTTLAGVAVDVSTDRLFVGWNGGFVTEYGSQAEENKALSTITHEKMHSSLWVAVDAERRRLYASSCQNSIFDCGILVFDADSHTLLKELYGENTPAGKFFSTKGWLSTAVNEESGHFFVADLESATKRIYEFDESYEYVASISSSEFQGGLALQIGFSNSSEAAENHHFLFVPTLLSSGRALAFNPPDVQPPKVDALAVTNIGEGEAELQATVAPRGAQTEYVFEYVTEEEFEKEGFANPEIGAEGTIAKDAQPTEVIALLNGLAPGTTYRFRVVAANEKGADEEEGTFTTYSDAPISESCPNQALRLRASALLPDCRAYELVTPADTNGRPTKGVGFHGDRFTTLEVSPLGNDVSFVTEGGSLPGFEGTGGFNGDPYRATRGVSGWTTTNMGPTGTQTNIPLPGSPSADQGHLFWGAAGEGSAVINGQASHYIRYPDGRSELVGRGSLGTDPGAMGKFITAGATHIIFQTIVPEGSGTQLEPEAPPTGTEAVYDRTSDEVTHVVSLLPGDITPAAGQHATYVEASTDGNGVAFEIGSTLYLRKGNAVTYEIGENVEAAGISEDGERIFYVEDDDLFAFDTGAEEAIAFTDTGDATVVNVASDGSRAYFVSPSVIPGSGTNPNGASAQAGQENLYLSEEGAARFVATVTKRDVEGEVNSVGALVDGLGLWTEVHATQPAKDPSRATPDGSVLLFQSRANLDGYDSGGFPQIYRYDSVEERLHCISCIPTKAPAAGGASLETFAASQGNRPPFSAYGFVPNLRSDGDRAFFESKEALVSTDTDGVQDVYEWEEEGVGSCDRPGGCVYLISSGQSARDNYLYGVSRTGDDVFFITEDVLVAGDNDTSSIYDARVGGGFPEPQEKECFGEGCRPVLTPAPVLTPPAQPAAGNDNVRPGPSKSGPRKCRKGKRKVKRNGKVRCVKKKQKRQQQKTRRAGARRGGSK